MIIGLDLGFGFVKAASESGQRVCFPSLVGSAHSLLGDWFGTTPYEVRWIRDGMDARYFVGELARREAGDTAINLRDRKHQDVDTQVLAGTALALLGHGQPLQVVTGLPLSHYDALGAELRNAIQNLNGTMIRVENQTHRLSIESVRVIPQAMGAMMAGLLGPDLRPRDPQWLQDGGLLVLIDVGTRTTGVVTFQTHPSFDLIRGNSAATDMGMFQAHQSLHDALHQMAGSAPPLEETDFYERLWSKPHVFYAGAERDLTAACSQAQERLGQRIARWVLQTLGPERSQQVRSYFVAGGGASVVLPVLQHVLEPVVSVPDPQMANAIGYAWFGRSRQGGAR